MSWIQTYTGKKFDLFRCVAEDVCIEDIAHALSMQCRFVGHCKKFYSVAEHSVWVSRLCQPENAMWGLLHDAAEAYLGDVSRPLKQNETMIAYRNAEAKVMELVCRRFGLFLEEPKDVKLADSSMLAFEARNLFRTPPVDDWDRQYPILSDNQRVEGWLPGDAEVWFIDRYYEIKKGS